MALLQVQALDFSIGKKKILHGISFDAQQGQTVALLGPNGAGKTTLLKTIMGLQSVPTHKSILFDDNIIDQLPVHQRVSQGLLYLPQHTSLFQSMTVRENLDIVYHYHPFWKEQSKKQFDQDAAQWLDVTQLASTITQKAGTLSGGQKRKLEVVRCLLMKPKMLMLDEPFAGVDPKSIYELKQIFTDLAKSNMSIVISDHHVDQLLSIAQNVYVIVGGKVVTAGGIKEILENTYTKESYLGTQFYQEIAQRFLH